MADLPDGRDGQAPAPDPRYCENCGDIFAAPVVRCPHCGVGWHGSVPTTIREVARALTLIAAKAKDNSARREALEGVREQLEERLIAARPPRRVTTAAIPPPQRVSSPAAAHPLTTAAAFAVGPAAPEVVPRPARPEEPPKPPGKPLTEVAGAWASERQADILLYLGAFLLTISAIIFVAARGELVSGLGRFVIVTIYIVAVLGLGVSLHRWARVREAGPVFLALGAILVPMDFVALRTQVLDQGALPNDILWLLGSSVSAMLYVTLASRGYGRLYSLPAIPALLVAWGSLGLVVNLPAEWLGAWFEAAAGALYVSGLTIRWRYARWLVRAAVAIAVPALLFAHVAAPFSETDRGQLPAAYAFLAAAVATGLYLRPSAVRMAALPPFAAMTALTLGWAVFDLQPEWYGSFAALTAMGYLAVAHFHEQRFTQSWGMAAAWFFALALGGSHAAMQEPAAEHAALPVAYAAVLAGAVAAFVRFRWREAVAVVPLLSLGTVISAWWAAAGLHVEWYGALIVAAGLGYLVIAHFATPPAARYWGTAAAAMGAAGLVWAHVSMTAEGAAPVALPVAYVVALAGSAAAFARFRWKAALAIAPLLRLGAMVSAWWAADGFYAEWYGALIASVGLGYLVIAHFAAPSAARYWGSAAAAMGLTGLGWAHSAMAGSGTDHAALPAAYGVVLFGALAATVRWRWQWRAAPGSLPVLASFTAIATAWAAWALTVEWWGGLLAAAAFGYLLLAHLDRPARSVWWQGAGFSGFTALVLTHLVIADGGLDRPALPVAYGVVLVAYVAAFARWRWELGDGFAIAPWLPVGFGASLVWAAGDMPLSWLGCWVAGAALGYTVLSVTPAPRRENWRSSAFVAGTLALGWAHFAALADQPDRAQLPAAYAVLMAGAILDAVRRQAGGLLLLPALAAAGGGALLWSLDAPPEWWPFPALGVGAALLATFPAWARVPALTRYGWTYGLALAALPTLVFLPVHYQHPAFGLAATAASAALLLGVSAGARGTVAMLVIEPVANRQRATERVLLFQLAVAFVLAAIGFGNAVFEVADADRAWAFALTGTLAWAGVVIGGRRPAVAFALVPIALAALSLAAGLSYPSYGVATAVFAIGAAGPAIAFATTGRWTFAGLAASFLSLTGWTFWGWRDLDPALLPAAYAGFATVCWLALYPLRRYSRLRHEPDAVIALLSWVPWILSAGVSAILLENQRQALSPAEPLVQTREWALAAVVLASAAAAVTAEGWRLRLRAAWIPGTLGLLTALLMAIATAEPSNVQAYAAPVGVYVILLSLTYRRTPSLFGDQMELHEAMMVVGALFLVLPPVEQSFDPGGAKFGFELIGLASVFLAVGLVLHAR